jgi:hypothetical protein
MAVKTYIADMSVLCNVAVAERFLSLCSHGLLRLVLLLSNILRLHVKEFLLISHLLLLLLS